MFTIFHLNHIPSDPSLLTSTSNNIVIILQQQYQQQYCNNYNNKMLDSPSLHSLHSPAHSPSKKRISTQELFPSYRQNFQIHQLIQEVSQAKRIISLKNKQIYYLSSQTVSIKQQYTQKILHLESVIAENKKQLNQLRYLTLKSKRLESEKCDKIVNQIKSSYQLQLKTMKDSHQSIVERINVQHLREIQGMEEKMLCLLNLEKREKVGLETGVKERQENYEKLLLGLENENSKLRSEKGELKMEIGNYEKSIALLKQEFKKYMEKSENIQQGLSVEKEKLRGNGERAEEERGRISREYENLKGKSENEIGQLKDEIGILKEEIKKYKQAVRNKDKELALIIQAAEQHEKSRKIQHYEHMNNNLQPVRVCNHEGLIRQMEKNIAVKNKENQDLRDQLTEWGKYIGFDIGCEDRSSDLLNASSQALQVQASFNSTLRRKFNKC